MSSSCLALPFRVRAGIAFSSLWLASLAVWASPSENPSAQSDPGVFHGNVPATDYLLSINGTTVVEVPGNMVCITDPRTGTMFNLSRERVLPDAPEAAHPGLKDPLSLTLADALTFAARMSSITGRAFTLPTTQQLGTALDSAAPGETTTCSFGAVRGEPREEWTRDATGPATERRPFRLVENAPKRWQIDPRTNTASPLDAGVALAPRASVEQQQPSIPSPPPLKPEFTTQPASQAVVAGGTATFTADARASNSPTYQWFFNGDAIPGATSRSLVLAKVQSSATGVYWVVATNTVIASGETGLQTFTYSTYSDLAVLRVTQPGETGEPPRITQQPVSRTVASGSDASFTVRVAGTAPVAISLRWTFTTLGGTSASPTSAPVISFDGETARIQVSNVEPGHAGDYALQFTNAYGTVTSSAATLRVIAGGRAPSITTQPANTSVTRGGSTTFTVAANGNPEPSFQWNLNGSPIAGATASSLSISNAQSTHAGSYTVTVKNDLGELTSNAATLTVNNGGTSTGSSGGGGGAPHLGFVAAAILLLASRRIARRN